MGNYQKKEVLQPGIHQRQRHAEARHGILSALGLPHFVIKNVFSFCKVRHVLSLLRMTRGIPRACLTLICQQAMAQIAAAACEACGYIRCTVYTIRGEAVAPHLGLPLPQVYSQLSVRNIFQKDQTSIWVSVFWALQSSTASTF